MEFVGAIIGLIILATLSYLWHLFWSGRRKKARGTKLASAAEALERAGASLELGHHEEALQLCQEAMILPGIGLGVSGSGTGAFCAALDEAQELLESLPCLNAHYSRVLDTASHAHDIAGGSLDRSSFDALVSVAVAAAEKVIKMQRLGNWISDKAFDRRNIATDILGDLGTLGESRTREAHQLLTGIRSCLHSGEISDEVSRFQRPWMTKEYDDSPARAGRMVEAWKQISDRCSSPITRDDIVRGTSVDSLRSALSCTDHNLRALAAVALGKAGTHDDVALIGRLVHDPCHSVQIAAIEALASIGGEAALTEMRQFAEDPEVEVAGLATITLARLGT